MRLLTIFSLILASAVASLAAPASRTDPDFQPELVDLQLTAPAVRPGDPFAVTIRFRNAGKAPARSDYHVFLHFESPSRDCRNIVIHGDHAPSEPTSLWMPGQVVTDGPKMLVAPADRPEVEYFIHVGVYDLAGAGERLLDVYAPFTLRVTRSAPPASQMAPPPLPAADVARRRQALAARIPAARRVSLQAPSWRFDLDRSTGTWALTDRKTGVFWTSDPARPGFGHVILKAPGRTAAWRLDRWDAIRQEGGRLRLVARPRVDGQPCGVELTVTVEPVSHPPGVKLTYDSRSDSAWQVAQVRLLDQALTVTEAEGGCVYVPYRLGIERRAGTGLPGREDWLTYDGLSMAMCGAVKNGSALLVNWDHVDTRLGVDATWPDSPLVPGRRARSVSLEVMAPRGACTLHPLGRGGYVEIARAYRPLARAKGWLRTWSEKRKRTPSVDRIFGAHNFKPFVFSRVMPTSVFSDGKEHTHLGFTFDEVAQCAEHWRRDLGIDRAYVVLAGWINGGYDVRHPDVLPAAPECGGNAGLQAAARRIKACGYLFGLHDNYQDMYEDAPSWGLEWLNKDARGVPKMGGNWNGGQAWQVCAIKQVELAAREKTNFPEIARLFGPTIYFSDTVFAWPLVTCEDPAHPMTRSDDLKWKTRLCLLAKRYFGLFGSEEGREWAVPCADYLEGIFGHQTDSPVGDVIPLFPLVYSDCVQIMTHQGNRIGPGDERKVADHILFAEMPLPRFGEHLYWKTPVREGVSITPLPPVVRDLGNRRVAITYRWQTDRRIPDDLSVFVHFTHKASSRPEGIVYQNDHMPTTPTSQWEPGRVIDDGPHVVTVPPGFDEPAEVYLGMLRNGERIPLGNLAQEGGRYHVGTLTVNGNEVRFEPAPIARVTELWSRGDGGWGEKLCPTDRVIKNTWEVLSPLNTITAEVPLTSHQFLTPDRRLQRTRFGDVTITVAYEKPARIGAHTVPAYGFVVESPRFVAFCATRYNGVDYRTPTLFTARSLDGKPIAQSGKVRIYHGFGDRRIRLAGKTFTVAREAVVRVR